jgi:membrane protease YdiL (CAAX protease family)
MGVVILLVGGMLASLPADLFYALTEIEPSAAFIIRPVLEITVLSSIVYLYIRKALKRCLQEFRICKPKSIYIWGVCALVLPLAVSTFYIFFIPGEFGTSDFETSRKIVVILRAILSSCLVTGITEELVFRGLIMRVLEIRWGKTIAVIVPSVIFGALHIFSIDSLSIVDTLILLVAGTAVGVMFSLVTIQSNSIWASAIMHGIWNLIIVGRILDINIQPSSALFSYRLMSNSYFLTGGEFGIEASLPAIIGYTIVIALALILIKRDNDTNNQRKNSTILGKK